MKNEIGNKYGKLTVIKFHHTNKNGNAFWLCSCDCGLSTVVCGSYLRNGHTTSCGCSMPSSFKGIHGYSDKEPLYGVWEQMRSRCNNKNNPRYGTYGTAGISVCKEWDDYSVFREWAFSNGYAPAPNGTPRGKRPSIDRIDPSKGYEPSNCRWITVSENISWRFECHANQSGSFASKGKTRATHRRRTSKENTIRPRDCAPDCGRKDMLNLRETARSRG